MLDIDKTRFIFEETVQDYMDLFGMDLSYMRLKISRDNEYVDGSPCYDFEPDEWAGTHTNLGYIILNPDIELSMKRHAFEGTIEEFTKLITAHELAHEIWENEALSDEEFKMEILEKADAEDFTTLYLETVSDEILGKETFCEYLAGYVLANGRKTGLIQS